MGLGLLFGVSAAVVFVLSAVFGFGGSASNDLRDLWIMVGAIPVAAVALGFASRISSFFPRMLFGFCAVLIPGALAAGVICLFTDQATYAIPLFCMAPASALALWICGRITRPVQARMAYVSAMQVLEAEAARTESRGGQSMKASRAANVTPSKTGGPTVASLIATFRNYDGSQESWEAATTALGQMGSRAVKPLVGALNDPDAYVRQGAAEALGKIGDVRAVEPLIVAARDEDESVRLAACLALGEIGAPEAVGPLVEALKDADEYVRNTAATALGEIGAPEAVGPLIAALRDPEWYVRGAAATALGEIGDAGAVEALSSALKDENESVRQDAAAALAQISG